MKTYTVQGSDSRDNIIDMNIFIGSVHGVYASILWKYHIGVRLVMKAEKPHKVMKECGNSKYEWKSFKRWKQA